MNFLAPFAALTPAPFETIWRSPSNIAFVKYWGKKGHQLPANPSLSMTLRHCYTETRVRFEPREASEGPAVELFLDGGRQEKFAAKIAGYLRSLEALPWLADVRVTVDTRNTFPHGTGIASSASGLSAFALGLSDYLFHLSGVKVDFFKTASFLARLASGSACRSVYGGFVSWGEESDLYASPVDVHSSLAHLRDSVLVVSGEEKAVSSTAGHGRMSDHVFSEARFAQARANYARTRAALAAGDLATVGVVLESEALALHAMMLTAPAPFTLLKPNTLAAIEMIWAFRRETQLPLFFTLDAGPNLHLIYPEVSQHKVRTFIAHELSPLAQTVINDECGEGPVKC
jgi:diphosphomevalonate decarboxylase